jgi:hypothetical protein
VPDVVTLAEKLPATVVETEVLLGLEREAETLALAEADAKTEKLPVPVVETDKTETLALAEAGAETVRLPVAVLDEPACTPVSSIIMNTTPNHAFLRRILTS